MTAAAAAAHIIACRPWEIDGAVQRWLRVV